jgi:arylsulfatase A-like enzyme
MEAHHPRVPSQEARLAVLDEAERTRALTADLSLFAQHAAMERRHVWTPDDLAALRDVYDASLWDLDRATAALFDDLSARGILDDTVVVLLSDHGEHLGEHGMFEHRWSIREPIVGVPLVVRWPGHVPPGRRAEPVSTASLVTTLAALTGLPAPEAARAVAWFEPRDGPVFTELWHPNPRLPFIESAFPDLPRDRWKRRLRVARQNDWKVVYASDGDAKLYDLATDPDERRDVAKQHGDVARAGLAALAGWQRRLPHYDPALRGPDDHPRPALAPDDPLREQLDVLGYTVEEPP